MRFLPNPQIHVMRAPSIVIGLQVAEPNIVKMHQCVLFLRGQQRTQITFEQQQISHGFRGRFAQTDVNLHQIARKYSTLVYNMVIGN